MSHQEFNLPGFSLPDLEMMLESAKIQQDTGQPNTTSWPKRCSVTPSEEPRCAWSKLKQGARRFCNTDDVKSPPAGLVSEREGAREGLWKGARRRDKERHPPPCPPWNQGQRHHGDRNKVVGPSHSFRSPPPSHCCRSPLVFVRPHISVDPEVLHPSETWPQAFTRGLWCRISVLGPLGLTIKVLPRGAVPSPVLENKLTQYHRGRKLYVVWMRVCQRVWRLGRYSPIHYQ